MEIARFPSHRGFSVRSIFTFALAALITALLWIISFSYSPVNAQTPTASWSGDSIMFDTRQYSAIDRDQLTGINNIPNDAKIYINRDGTDVAQADRKAYIIYFAPGLDPPTAEKATAVTYNISATGALSNAQNSREISITKKGDEGSYSSCNVSGVGWIICPVSVFLADSMDFIFTQILENFLKVQPIVIGGDNNDLYKVWEIMRSVANIAFIIAFLIIIYSQLANIQVSNYGLKKLLPRLIIAAILVNISFIITAIAVDLSNILGQGIHQVFINLRQDVFNVDDATFGDDINWGTLTAAILGGGTLGYFAAGSMVGMSYIIVPLLVGLALTLIMVLLVLAARQAIIIILIIIAPLAFVAYILPNTEKWYERWQSILFTMLVFFPAFALVFGGSQLAGQIIIQNAGNNFIMVVLGLAVQVAPLVITPIILKFSGNLLGRIAQIVNDPRKGFTDRANNWKNDRQDMRRQQNLSKDNKWYNPGRAALKRLDSNSQQVKRRTAMYRQMADNNYEKSKRYGKLNPLEKAATMDKEKIHAHHDEHAENLKRTKGSVLYDRSFATEKAKKDLSSAQDTTTRFYNTIQSNERFANRVGASALHTSSYNAETSKDRLAASESLKTAFYNNERADGTTGLGKTAFKVESGKLKADTAQNLYTARVETMKSTPGSVMSVVAQKAESSKEHLEYAQTQLQRFFDTQRRDASTDLGQSTIKLEKGKMSAEDAKNKLTTYLTEERFQDGGALKYDNLRVERSKSRAEEAEANLKTYVTGQKADGLLREQTVITEQAKHTQQQSDLNLTRVIEEFKAGGLRKTDPITGKEVIFINGKQVSNAERALANEMYATTEMIAAENTGIQAAKNEAQQRVSTILATEKPGEDATAEQLRTYERAEQLLNIAGSIDDNGQQRALANALAQRSKSRSEVLGNISSIIGFRNFSTAQIRTLAEGGEVAGIDNSHDVTAAAIQMTFAGKDNGQIVQALKNIDFSFPDATPEEREELQILAADALSGNSSRPPFLSAGVIAGLKAGNSFENEPVYDDLGQPVLDDEGNQVFTPVPFSGAYGKTGLNELIMANLNAGKLDSKKLQTAGKDYVQPIWDAIKANPKALNIKQQARLMKSLAQTLNPNNEASEGLADSIGYLENIFSEYGGKFEKGIPIVPDDYIQIEDAVANNVEEEDPADDTDTPT